MLANYSFYKNIYGGSLISEKEFIRYGSFASAFVKNMICCGSRSDTDISLAVCHVAEIFFRHDTRLGVASENNDGYSISYDKNTSAEKLATEVAKVYLAGKGLLYCGIG